MLLCDEGTEIEVMGIEKEKKKEKAIHYRTCGLAKKHLGMPWTLITDAIAQFDFIGGGAK